ncbi:hypothetical protein F4805DRAFT_227606 [Annulohypoxylon moriforme]|nr:hypothetical protein F4805DRAFT_227606 [Annulohypoxylon moriforme]
MEMNYIGIIGLKLRAFIVLSSLETEPPYIHESRTERRLAPSGINWKSNSYTHTSSYPSCIFNSSMEECGSQVLLAKGCRQNLANVDEILLFHDFVSSKHHGFVHSIHSVLMSHQGMWKSASPGFISLIILGQLSLLYASCRSNSQRILRVHLNRSERDIYEIKQQLRSIGRYIQPTNHGAERTPAIAIIGEKYYANYKSPGC